MLCAMDARRAVPVAVVAVVLGFLGWQTLRHRDAKPREDPEAASGKGPGTAVDIYATSGKNKRLTGEGDPALPEGHPPPRTPLPEGHPPLPAGHPSAADPHAGAIPAGDDPADAGLPIAFTVPAGWTRQEPSNAMRLAQWSLAAEPGGEPGEVVLSTAGGGLQANIDRWAKQFGQPHATTRELTVHGLPVTRVELSGTFAGMTPPGGAPAAPKEGWRLLGAVVPLESTLLFVKATGPAPVMAREEKAFDAFLASLKPK
jgi:gluconolactonase